MNRRPRRTRFTRRSVRAFTLAELLVVTGIIVLLLLITVPAAQQVLESTVRARAFNSMQNALRSARDAAVRSPSGDTAAVFLYDRNQGVVVVTAQQIGSITDTSNGPAVDRDVFVPMDIYEPLTIPRPWSVRGYAPAGTITNDWYGLPGTHPYATIANSGHWVFPFNDFFQRNAINDGIKRVSFMVRFRAGDGTLVRGAEPALVVDPSPVSSQTLGRPVAPGSPLDVLQAPDLRTWSERMLFDNTVNQNQRDQMMGFGSVDSVLCGVVSELALYDERELAAALALRGLNRDTNTIYRDRLEGANPNPTPPELDPRLSTNGLDNVRAAQLTTDWVQALADPNNTEVIAKTSARIFVVNPYSGQLIEVEP